MIRYATIGTSSITECFIKGCEISGRFKHVAVYSRDEERGRAFTAKDGCKKVYTDLEALANDKDIDAVYIASVNSCHAAQTRLMLQNGKHVICEKPCVTSPDDYIALKKFADEKGLIYIEAITSRHSKSREALKEAIAQVGRTAHIRIDFCQRSSRLDRFYRGEHVNIFDMSLSAGTLNDLGVYCVYAAVDLFGVPQSITASASYFDNGADSSGTAVFDYKNVQAVLTYSKAGQSAIGSEIIGDNATVTIGSVSQYTDVKLLKGGKTEVIVPNIEKPEIMSGEATDFANYIEFPEKYKPDYDNTSLLTLNVHKCMAKIRESAQIKYK